MTPEPPTASDDELLEHVDDAAEVEAQQREVPRSGPLRFARMTGSSIAARDAAPWVTDFLNAAYYRRAVDAREVDQPNGGEELTSPYVDGDQLDLHAWAHDAFALAMPAQVLCLPDCLGLCPQCGANLNADPAHAHEAAPDPRWAKLRELKLE